MKTLMVAVLVAAFGSMAFATNAAADDPLPSIAVLRSSEKRSMELAWIDEVSQKVIGCDTEITGASMTPGSIDWADGADFGAYRELVFEQPINYKPDSGGVQGCPRNVRPFDRGSKYAVIDVRLQIFESSTQTRLFFRPVWSPLMARDNMVLFDGARDAGVAAGVQRVTGDVLVVDLDRGQVMPGVAFGDGYNLLDMAVSPDGLHIGFITVKPWNMAPQAATEFQLHVFEYDPVAATVVRLRETPFPVDGFVDVHVAGGAFAPSAPTWLLIDDDESMIIGTRRTFGTVSAAGELELLPRDFVLDQRPDGNIGRPYLLADGRIAFSSTASHLESDRRDEVADEAYLYSVETDTFYRIGGPTSIANRFGISADGRAVIFRESQIEGLIGALVTDVIDDISVVPQDQELVIGQSAAIEVTVANASEWMVPLDDVNIDLGVVGRASCGPVQVPAGGTVTCEAQTTSPVPRLVDTDVSVVQWGARRDLGSAGTVEFLAGPSAPRDVRLVPAADGNWRVTWTPPDWRGAATRREYRVQLFYDDFATSIFCIPAGDDNGWFDATRLRSSDEPYVDCGPLDPRIYTVEVGARTPFGEALSDRVDFSTAPPVCSGYWMFDVSGRFYEFGDAAKIASVGSSSKLVSMVAATPTSDGSGLWMLRDDGTVSVSGTARHFGDVDRRALAAGERLSSLSATPDGSGYWVFTDRGRAISFGSAVHRGDMVGTTLNGPVVASVATPTGGGYYMVASDGGIFAFGDAKFVGSMGDVALNRPIVGIAPDPDGTGYWLVASDGGIFAFEAEFHGSMGGVALNQPVIGAVAYGDGYLLAAADGGVFSFVSTASFFGSLGGRVLPQPIAGFAAFAVC